MSSEVERSIPGPGRSDQSLSSYHRFECVDTGSCPTNPGNCPTIFLRRHAQASQGTILSVRILMMISTRLYKIAFERRTEYCGALVIYMIYDNSLLFSVHLKSSTQN